MGALISILIAVIVIGLLFWLCGQLPFDAKMKQVVQVVLVVICIIWVLQELVFHVGGFYIR
jgi:hypothetical protein